MLRHGGRRVGTPPQPTGIVHRTHPSDRDRAQPLQRRDSPTSLCSACGPRRTPTLPPAWMFKRLFGGGDGAGSAKPQAPAVAPRATTSTVDAIQKLGEVGGRPAWPARAPPLPPPPPLAPCCPLPTAAAAAPLPLQSEELLQKRRDLLEKKIAAELNRAKEHQKKGNKKGAAACGRVAAASVGDGCRREMLLPTPAAVTECAHVLSANPLLFCRSTSGAATEEAAGIAAGAGGLVQAVDCCPLPVPCHHQLPSPRLTALRRCAGAAPNGWDALVWHPAQACCILAPRLQIDNSLARLGEQRAALENLTAQAEVINALKTGADASKTAMKVRGSRRGA